MWKTSKQKKNENLHGKLIIHFPIISPTEDEVEEEQHKKKLQVL